MKLVKNIRPFYAKWWFFLGLIILGWLTPITKNWYLFLFGESTIALPINIYGKSTIRFYAFIYTLNGYRYVSSDAFNLRGEIPEKSIKIYYHKKYPNNNITFNLNRMYSGQNLFFPLGLQIALGVFFLLVRFNEIEN